MSTRFIEKTGVGVGTKPDSIEFPLVNHQEVLEGASTVLDMRMAREMKLGLPKGWLDRDEKVEIEISRGASKPVGNPPEELLTELDRMIIYFSKQNGKEPQLQKGQEYYPEVTITRKDTGEVAIVRAEQLLPHWMRGQYGYSTDSIARMTVCHSAALQYNDSQFAERINPEPGGEIKYLLLNYDVLQPTERLRLGDYVLFVLYIQEDEEPIHVRHSAIYIGPGLIFGKGDSQSWPLYITDAVEIARQFRYKTLDFPQYIIAFRKKQ